MEDREIAERCVLQMLNEAARCLAEGILRSARDGDIGAVFGLGFPPFRGGPFRFIDALGAAEVVARLEHYGRIHGPRFETAPLLIELANEGRRFYPEASD
jgi:3-hydroxyacyl-CoA dehydrogenase/enoyl-CoA hydratase/3-hydroxybutyryl-CoA epimerase